MFCFPSRSYERYLINVKVTVEVGVDVFVANVMLSVVDYEGQIC